jgi:hypothetical protein
MNQQILILVLVLAVVGVMSTVFMMSSEKAVINLPSQTVGEGLKIVTFNPDTGKINTQYSIGSVVQAVDTITNAYKAADASVLDNVAKNYFTQTRINQLRASDKVTNANETIARIANARHAEQAKLSAAADAKYDAKYLHKGKDYKMLVAGGNQNNRNTFAFSKAGNLVSGGGSGRPFRFLDMDTRDYEGQRNSSNLKLRRGGTGANYNEAIGIPFNA